MLDIAAKPVIGIVMVALVIAAAAALVGVAREVRESRLSVPEVSNA
ncbi:MAG TPA: hypothetical protein VM778_00500 [Gemmatimonadota bacterium]|nr:hypothetical protein [Gemmatimonadota bacterium]